MRILLVVFTFLIGSIPFGVIFTKGRGIDLKKTGSGNIGATNVLRTAGKLPALLTLLGDIFKGSIAIAVCKLAGAGDAFEAAAAVAVVSGHIFSPFVSFKGGKGVATGFGVLLIYSPKVAVITFILWLATAYISRFSSLAAVISFGFLPLNIFILDYAAGKFVAALIIMILLMLRHRENIRRLMAGTESRIGQKPEDKIQRQE